MEDNKELDNDINELIDRANDQVDDVESESNNVDNSVNNEEIVQDNNKLSGYFHERDSLAENNIVDEVKTSFLEYSMSVITSRAFPDLRDGLKPVHRRILWSMYNSGYTPINHIVNLRKLSVKLWVIITLMVILLYTKLW